MHIDSRSLIFFTERVASLLLECYRMCEKEATKKWCEFFFVFVFRMLSTSNTCEHTMQRTIDSRFFTALVKKNAKYFRDIMSSCMKRLCRPNHFRAAIGSYFEFSSLASVRTHTRSLSLGPTQARVVSVFKRLHEHDEFGFSMKMLLGTRRCVDTVKWHVRFSLRCVRQTGVDVENKVKHTSASIKRLAIVQFECNQLTK